MKFVIGRTSEGMVSANPPFPGAERGPEAPSWPGEYAWFVELNTLDELMHFVKEQGGGLALFSPEADDEFPEIEIFDEVGECGSGGCNECDDHDHDHDHDHEDGHMN